MFKELFTEASMKKLRKITPEFVKDAVAITDLDKKRKFVLDFIGTDVNTPSEAKLREQLPSMTAQKIDKVLYDMLLAGDGLAVNKKTYGS